MVRHNLLISYRSILRNKASFCINLIGLSSGLASVFLIYLWVSDELKVDQIHQKEVYQIINKMELSDGARYIERSPYPLEAVLSEEMPEVEHAVAINDFSSYRSKEGLFTAQNKSIQAKGWHATEDFFEVFSYELLEGNKAQLWEQTDGILLSSELALKMFGTSEGLVGKSIEWKHTAYEKTFQIYGVYKSPPANSTLQFDFLLNMKLFKDNAPYSNSTNWLGSYVKTFVVLKQGASLDDFNAKIGKLMMRQHDFLENFTLFAKLQSSIYLHGKRLNVSEEGARISYVRLFSLIAILILIIACVNFMNLSTARASIKMKAIGVKKTIGASRKSLILQYLLESLITTFASFLLASVMVGLLLPQFNEISGKNLELFLSFSDMMAIIGIVLFTALFAGSYPAFYLSGFRPVAVLKGNLKTKSEALWLRKGLVIFQFSLSVIFIVAFLIVNEQIKYTQSKNMGYNRDNILCFTWKGELFDQWTGLLEGKTNDKFEVFRSRLPNIPGVISFTNMSGNILNDIYKTGGVSWEGMEEEHGVSMHSPVVGYDFIETLGIKLLEGRTFSEERKDDYSKIILNKAAADLMGYENPVGEIIRYNKESEIIGVVENFHYGSLYNPIEPLLFRFDPHGRNIMIKIQAGTEKNTLEQIKVLHKEILPNYLFEFSFLDEDYQALYEAETRVASLSNYMAVLAIIISCLGLFGLASFSTERRAKEIGIRKILGSSVMGIIHLLSQDFLKMVGIAIGLAIPISYILSKNWLENFAFSIELGWWFFVAASGLTLLIAYLTVAFQGYKAASVKPVDSLRDE
ncbi:MAG: ABC transporter permease [Bacteroidota bacterium]